MGEKDELLSAIDEFLSNKCTEELPLELKIECTCYCVIRNNMEYFDYYKFLSKLYLRQGWVVDAYDCLVYSRQFAPDEKRKKVDKKIAVLEKQVGNRLLMKPSAFGFLAILRILKDPVYSQCLDDNSFVLFMKMLHGNPHYIEELRGVKAVRNLMRVIMDRFDDSLERDFSFDGEAKKVPTENIEKCFADVCREQSKENLQKRALEFENMGFINSSFSDMKKILKSEMDSPELNLKIAGLYMKMHKYIECYEYINDSFKNIQLSSDAIEMKKKVCDKIMELMVIKINDMNNLVFYQNDLLPVLSNEFIQHFLFCRDGFEIEVAMKDDDFRKHLKFLMKRKIVFYKED